MNEIYFKQIFPQITVYFKESTNVGKERIGTKLHFMFILKNVNNDHYYTVRGLIFDLTLFNKKSN